MKTKDYISKYHLDTIPGISKLNHNEFASDLTIDFMTLLEVGNGNTNIKGFENAVRAIRMKWDAVNNKTVGQLPDKLWNYFYATTIIGFKKNLFPDIIKAEEAKRKAQQEAYERKRVEDRYDTFSFFNFFAADFMNDLIKRMFEQRIPHDAFTTLGLDHTASIELVKDTYRTLSLKYHPDKGGNNDMFIAITEAKNKCLMYLQSKTK
jgi:hypothetical protein